MCFGVLRRYLRSISSFKVFILIFVICVVLITYYFLPSTFILHRNKIGSANFRNRRIIKNLSTKYILLWSSYDYHPFPILRQKGIFSKNNCSFQNCIVTTDRNYFDSDLSKFDAIALNGRKLIYYKSSSNIISRGTHKSLHQKYIYVNTGSAWYYPVCSFKFDNLFNWTMTYKLNSDVPYPYIQIRDKSGNIVGPKIDMHWKKNMTDVDDDVIRRIKKKKKAVAWFISECHTVTNKKEFYMANCLKKELNKRGYVVDTYGACGSFRCHSERACNKKLEDYYFFLAYEDPSAEDYVAGKVLTSLTHYTVPVVYGDVNYSRFLPPYSYLNARYTPTSRLAFLIIKLIQNPHLYQRYFGWRQHYTYHNPISTDNVCAVCAAMNNPKMITRTEYPQLRAWWNPPSPNRCQQGLTNNDVNFDADI